MLVLRKDHTKVYTEAYNPSSTCLACHGGGIPWQTKETQPPPLPRQVNGKDRQRRCEEWYGDNEGGRCWSACGGAGECPDYCGAGGACCRQGRNTGLEACNFGALGCGFSCCVCHGRCES